MIIYIEETTNRDCPVPFYNLLNECDGHLYKNNRLGNLENWLEW